MEQGPVKSFLVSQNCHIEFLFNPPSASHFGGVFERQISTIRKVLSGLLLEQSSCLTEECLITLLHEVSAIINCRPLSLSLQEHTFFLSEELYSFFLLQLRLVHFCSVVVDPEM